jgi:hypothetical protein
MAEQLSRLIEGAAEAAKSGGRGLLEDALASHLLHTTPYTDKGPQAICLRTSDQ